MRKRNRRKYDNALVQRRSLSFQINPKYQSQLKPKKHKGSGRQLILCLPMNKMIRVSGYVKQADPRWGLNALRFRGIFQHKLAWSSFIISSWYKNLLWLGAFQWDRYDHCLSYWEFRVSFKEDLDVNQGKFGERGIRTLDTLTSIRP